MPDLLKKLCLPALVLGLIGGAGIGCVDNSGNKTYPRGDSGPPEVGTDGGAEDVAADAPASDAPETDVSVADAPAGDTATDRPLGDTLNLDAHLDGTGG